MARAHRVKQRLEVDVTPKSRNDNHHPERHADPDHHAQVAHRLAMIDAPRWADAVNLPHDAVEVAEAQPDEQIADQQGHGNHDEQHHQCNTDQQRSSRPMQDGHVKRMGWNSSTMVGKFAAEVTTGESALGQHSYQCELEKPAPAKRGKEESLRPFNRGTDGLSGSISDHGRWPKRTIFWSLHRVRD